MTLEFLINFVLKLFIFYTLVIFIVNIYRTIKNIMLRPCNLGLQPIGWETLV